jgi:hypothetical protein
MLGADLRLFFYLIVRKLRYLWLLVNNFMYLLVLVNFIVRWSVDILSLVISHFVSESSVFQRHGWSHLTRQQCCKASLGVSKNWVNHQLFFTKKTLLTNYKDEQGWVGDFFFTKNTVIMCSLIFSQQRTDTFLVYYIIWI